jgi:hypothetical protein
MGKEISLSYYAARKIFCFLGLLRLEKAVSSNSMTVGVGRSYNLFSTSDVASEPSASGRGAGFYTVPKFLFFLD